MADERDIWEKLLDEEDDRKSSASFKRLKEQRQKEEIDAINRGLIGAAEGAGAFFLGRRALRAMTRGKLGKRVIEGDGNIPLNAAGLIGSTTAGVWANHKEGPLARAARERRKRK